MPKTAVEQFTVTATRDLAIRIVDTFHRGTEEEKKDTKKAFLDMATEMFDTHVKNEQQCILLLGAIKDGMEFGSWPTSESVGQRASPVGEKAFK